MEHEILKAYQDNDNLVHLNIQRTGQNNGGGNAFAAILRNCTYLKQICITGCNITDEQTLPMADAIRGNRSLEELDLSVNIDKLEMLVVMRWLPC